MMLSSLYPRNNFKWKISLENTSYVQREIFTVITACSLSNISLDAYNHPKWEKKNKGYRAHISILFFHFGSAHLYDHAFYMSFFFFNFTVLYWFCHTLTWIHHRCTWVPSPEPPSHLPPHIIIFLIKI